MIQLGAYAVDPKRVSIVWEHDGWVYANVNHVSYTQTIIVGQAADDPQDGWSVSGVMRRVNEAQCEA